MLFNSPVFLLLFLPLTLIGYHLVGRWGGGKAAVVFLLLASFVFYAYSSLFNFAVFITSILTNFTIGALIARHTQRRSILAIIGVTWNLALIGYFKYTGLLVVTANDLMNTSFVAPHILLPVGISFYTFQQITFLMDARRDGSTEPNLIRYALFVSFFPQLIAGPIIHPREILPQFPKDGRIRFHLDDFTIGLVFLFIGLFKKVILADGISAYATPVFDDAHHGIAPSLFSSWGAAFAYTFQIYFDFSGYCDMAVGMARMFSIRLPFNFSSPYKATNIIDFWRCWHMTLSRFLKDYLYIPFGGNRHGTFRRYINIMLTMLIGGLWHGGSWTFVIWGGLHGLYLVVNHLWRQTFGEKPSTFVSQWAGRMLTFLVIVVAWVFFRADSFSAASLMFEGMIGLHGLIPVSSPYAAQWFSDLLAWIGISIQPGVPSSGLVLVIWCAVLIAMVWFLPNTQEFILGVGRRENARFVWKPTLAWAAILGPCFGIALAYDILDANKVSEFIYFIF